MKRECLITLYASECDTIERDLVAHLISLVPHQNAFPWLAWLFFHLEHLLIAALSKESRVNDPFLGWRKFGWFCKDDPLIPRNSEIVLLRPWMTVRLRQK
jgi:hypothetical protein